MGRPGLAPDGRLEEKRRQDYGAAAYSGVTTRGRISPAFPRRLTS
jgi:hypothetical protein